MEPGTYGTVRYAIMAPLLGRPSWLEVVSLGAMRVANPLAFAMGAIS